MWCKACLDDKPLLDGTPYCASCTAMRMENQIREEVEKRQAPVRWNERNECIIDGEVWSVNKNLQTVKLRKAGGILLSDINGSNEKTKLVEKGNEKMGAMKELAIKNGQKGKGGNMATTTKTKKGTKAPENVEEILAQGTIVEVEPIGGPTAEVAEVKAEAPETVTVEAPKPVEAKKEEASFGPEKTRANVKAFIEELEKLGFTKEATHLRGLEDGWSRRVYTIATMVKLGVAEKIWPHAGTETGKAYLKLHVDLAAANDEKLANGERK